MYIYAVPILFVVLCGLVFFRRKKTDDFEHDEMDCPFD